MGHWALSKISALLKEAVENVGSGYLLQDWGVEADNDIIAFAVKFVGNGNKIEYKYNLRTAQT